MMGKVVAAVAVMGLVTSVLADIVKVPLPTPRANATVPRPSTLAPSPHTPTTSTPRPWSPDPSQLLGEYEEQPQPRDTDAYFVTANDTVVTVQVGSTAVLHCQVNDLAEHETVSWVRLRDHHIITVGDNTYSNDERFQLFHSDKRKDWTMRLQYAQLRDAGVYECQVSAHPPISVFTHLRVIEGRAVLEGGPERHVQVGSSVHLTCLLKDYLEPPTYAFWYHGHRMINYDASKRISVTSRAGATELHISSVTKTDSGNYTCAPANARPSSVSVHVITGETPAAMQRASANEVQYRVSLALMSVLVALIAL